MPAPKRKHQQNKADDRCLADLARAQEPHVNSHKYGDGNRHRDRKKSPRRVRERLYDDHRQDRHDDQHDEKNPDHRDAAGELTHLLFDHLAEALAAASRR